MINEGRRGASQQSALLTWLQHSSACLRLAEVTAPTCMGRSPHSSLWCASCFGEEEYTASGTRIPDSRSASSALQQCVFGLGSSTVNQNGWLLLAASFSSQGSFTLLEHAPGHAFQELKKRNGL